MRSKLIMNADDNYKDTYPMPRNPNGWYGVCLSRELKIGKVIRLSYFGKELVAFRDQNGKACILDAYCPHMGAHLGINSTVINGEIRCPFHQWQFNGEGHCTNAPFAKQTPRGDRTKAGNYPTSEINGIILIWHHSDRNILPSYEIPEFEEMNRTKFIGFTNFSLKLRTHVQEIRENFADESHFAFIHNQPGPAKLVFDTDGPRARMHSQLVFKKYGLNLTFDSVGEMYGPGVMIVRTTGIFHSAAIALSTPINDQYSELRMIVTAKKPRYAPWFAYILRSNILRIAYQDLVKEGTIWSNKRYYEQPIFQAHERTTPIFKRWYQQFYTKNFVQQQQQERRLKLINVDN